MQTPNPQTKLVALMSKPTKPELSRIVPEVVEWLTAHGYQVIVDRETSNYCKDLESVARDKIASYPLRFVVLLGGDGTLLSAARVLARSDIPVLGVNLGSLGFLTEVTVKELYLALEAADQGKASVEERSMLDCQVEREGKVLASYDALNEIVVGKNTLSRLNSFEVSIDGVFVSSYKADGLIISTPTGSTAYSLAAGGPILTPLVEAFVITPVAPHSLTHRPLVVRDNVEMVVVARVAKEGAFVSFDGQLGTAILEGDTIRCSKLAHKFKLLRFQSTFWDGLHSKLKWGQR
jgi:NAD+ kinase